MQQTFTSLAEARRRQVTQVGDIGTQDQTVSGRNLIHGLGKSFFTVQFPVVFAGRPVPLFGSQLDPRNPFIVLGSNLRATAMVAEYFTFGEVEGAFEGYHTGATICALIDGYKEQLTWVTWHFHGPALRNPVNTEEVVVL